MSLRRHAGRRTWLLVVVLLLAGSANSLSAQRYQLRDGRVLSAREVTLRDGQLIRTVSAADGASAEIGIPAAQVARLDFPEPAALAVARDALAAEQPIEALTALEPVVREFAPFPAVPGSWWAAAMQLRARALLAAELREEAIAAARALAGAAGGDPVALGTAQLLLAEIEARGGHAELALGMIDEILRGPAAAALEPTAWVLRGDLALARRAYPEALEAYLRLPAFWPVRDDLLPAALLGAARAYRGHGDAARAERTVLELIDTFSDTAEARTARREFQL